MLSHPVTKGCHPLSTWRRKGLGEKQQKRRFVRCFQALSAAHCGLRLIGQSWEGPQRSLGPTFSYRWGNETKCPRGDGTGPRCQGIFRQTENQHCLLALGQLGFAGAVWDSGGDCLFHTLLLLVREGKALPFTVCTHCPWQDCLQTGPGQELPPCLRRGATSLDPSGPRFSCVQTPVLGSTPLPRCSWIRSLLREPSLPQ